MFQVHFVLASAEESELFRVVVRELDECRGELELPERGALFADLSQASRFDSPEVTFVKRILQYYLPQPHRSRLVQRFFALCDRGRGCLCGGTICKC